MIEIIKVGYVLVVPNESNLPLSLIGRPCGNGVDGSLKNPRDP
ncbi:unannotated protein [freshwater metagenome]|uniref:Unannotated protein n=1 Tax=freshwater metagenome TaxID=449393 RepID=A0A6J6MIA3_9ZZZZ